MTPQLSLNDCEPLNPLPYPDVDDDLAQHMVNISLMLARIESDRLEKMRSPSRNGKKLAPHVLVKQLSGSYPDANLIKRILLAMYSQDLFIRAQVSAVAKDFRSYYEREAKA